jgi:2-(1,2-epoxy-1,2-dihydrophenyl)acetyl-CoA isomerase
VVAGIGISLALACDIRIMAESARFRAAWINRGFIPDGGATHLMPRLIGLPNAAEMCLTGAFFDSAYAERVGLVNRVVPDEEVMPTVMELAQKLAAGPPLAIARAKQALYKGLGNTLEEGIELEGFIQAELRRTEDHAEGVRSFMEKRAPVFRGR